MGYNIVEKVFGCGERIKGSHGKSLVSDNETREEENRNEKNLSAEEAAQKEGARLHEENGYEERKKGFSSQKSQGQSKINSLIRG